MYGGNVLNAIRAQAGGRYYIRVNGESDNGSAVFKIILSASAPLTIGVYANENNSPNRLDSVYFRSPARIWDGYISQYNATVAAFSPFGNPPATTWCSIDAIDASHLSGRLWGTLTTNTSTNSTYQTINETGKFQASF